MARNVLGSELEPCSFDPLTGFMRDGCCDSHGEDVGVHLVCVEMTDEFLAFSAEQGNDLVTPMPRVRLRGPEGRRPVVPVRAPLAGGVRSRRRAAGPPRRDPRRRHRMVLARGAAGARRRRVTSADA